MAEGTESLTPYQYANNNPVMFNDPLGNQPSDSRDSYNWQGPSIPLDPIPQGHGGGGDDFSSGDMDFFWAQAGFSMWSDGVFASAYSDGSSGIGSGGAISNGSGIGIGQSSTKGSSVNPYGLDNDLVRGIHNALYFGQALGNDLGYNYMLPGVTVSGTSELANAIQNQVYQTKFYGNMGSNGSGNSDFSWVGHSVSTVDAFYTKYDVAGSHISHAHYQGSVVDKGEGIFYSDRQYSKGNKLRSLSYGLNLQFAKIGYDLKDGGGSISVNVLGVNMYVGIGEDGVLFGSSYTHDHQIVGDDWSIRISDSNRAALQNLSNWMHNTFSPSGTSTPGVVPVIINGLKYAY